MTDIESLAAVLGEDLYAQLVEDLRSTVDPGRRAVQVEVGLDRTLTALRRAGVVPVVQFGVDTMRREPEQRPPTLRSDEREDYSGLLSALNRCEHGRHIQDNCWSCGDINPGNLHLAPGTRIGTDYAGNAIVAPEQLERHDPRNWMPSVGQHRFK